MSASLGEMWLDSWRANGNTRSSWKWRSSGGGSQRPFLHLLSSEVQALPHQLGVRVCFHSDSPSPWVGIIVQWAGGVPELPTPNYVLGNHLSQNPSSASLPNNKDTEGPLGQRWANVLPSLKGLIGRKEPVTRRRLAPGKILGWTITCTVWQHLEAKGWPPEFTVLTKNISMENSYHLPQVDGTHQTITRRTRQCLSLDVNSSCH